MMGSLVLHSGKPSPWTRYRGFSDLLFQLLPSISLHSTPPPHLHFIQLLSPYISFSGTPLLTWCR